MTFPFDLIDLVSLASVAVLLAMAALAFRYLTNPVAEPQMATAQVELEPRFLDREVTDEAELVAA